MNLEFWYAVLTSVVFWASVISFTLAIADAWLRKWFGCYPKSKYERVIQAIEDLADQIGNFWKSKLASKPWSGDDRRGSADSTSAGN